MTIDSDILTLCNGCGLCESVCSGVKMKCHEDGFYRPQAECVSSDETQLIQSVCPGMNVVSRKGGNHSIWGDVESVCNAWASDAEIRHSSSSGGVTTALAIYLLESGKVDAVLHVGTDDTCDYRSNHLCISRSREDVLKRNASRYAPALVLNQIKVILDSDASSYAFIGKPCDIAGMQNFVSAFPQYKGRIVCYLAIFCAGIPSFNATAQAIATLGHDAPVTSVRYRGDGWPGYFTVTYSDGTTRRMSYNDSWGMILGKQLAFRCKICPDSIGLLADIASGDAWNTRNGYPDFTEDEGRNFCFVRTPKGEQLMREAIQAGYIDVEQLDINKVEQMQRYQYSRRKEAGWRIAAACFLSGFKVHFRGTGWLRNAMTINPLRGLRIMMGSAKRYIRRKRHLQAVK